MYRAPGENQSRQQLDFSFLHIEREMIIIHES